VKLRGHLVSGVIAIVVLSFLWAPLLMTVVNAVNRDELLTSWSGVTLKWFRQALDNTDARSGLAATLKIAVASSLASAVIAVTGAMWWRGASRRGRRVFDVLTYMRIIMPEVVFAVALFLLFTKINVPLGALAVIAGHTVWNSAYATLIVQSRVITLDPILEDAAADLGATPVGAFGRVTLPILMPAVAAAGLLAFTFSFDDLVTSFYMSGTRIETLPVVLLSMIRFRISPEINAIGILVMATTITSMSTLYFLLSRNAQRGRRGAEGLAAAVSLETDSTAGPSGS
jgi:ABC-type spermidine/putrescine transport system permease subunit II